MKTPSTTKISRKSYLRNIKRVVIKVGSGVLTAENGLNHAIIGELTIQICALRKKGIEVIL